jgi:tryptophan synthase beta chain
LLAQTEGIIGALEPCHGLAWVIREAGRSIPTESTVLLTMSGRGDKDVALVMERLAGR